MKIAQKLLKPEEQGHKCNKRGNSGKEHANGLGKPLIKTKVLETLAARDKQTKRRLPRQKDETRKPRDNQCASVFPNLSISTKRMGGYATSSDSGLHLNDIQIPKAKTLLRPDSNKRQKAEKSEVLRVCYLQKPKSG